MDDTINTVEVSISAPTVDVVCPKHGLIVLTNEAYKAQLDDKFTLWFKCPECGRLCDLIGDQDAEDIT